MNDYLISMYIDNALDLDEKIDFVQAVHRDADYKTEAVELLRQEKQLRETPVWQVPPMTLQESSRPHWVQWLKPIMVGLGAAVTALLVFWMVNITPDAVSESPMAKVHRFVIFDPDIHSVQLTGSFTGWKPTALHPIGKSGYWEVEMPLPQGEHRFSYILNGDRRIPDPTIPVRERDDFGGENSIIRVSL